MVGNVVTIATVTMAMSAKWTRTRRKEAELPKQEERRIIGGVGKNGILRFQNVKSSKHEYNSCSYFFAQK